MIGFISDLFVALVEAISGFFELLMLFISGIHSAIGLLLGFVVSIPDYLFWLPSEVVAVVIGAFGLVVLYKFLGREG